MNVLCQKGLLAFKKFNIIDVGVFKTYLFSLGLLIGMCNKKASNAFKIFLGIVSIFSGVYIIYKFFYKYWERP